MSDLTTAKNDEQAGGVTYAHYLLRPDNLDSDLFVTFAQVSSLDNAREHSLSQIRKYLVSTII